MTPERSWRREIINNDTGYRFLSQGWYYFEHKSSSWPLLHWISWPAQSSVGCKMQWWIVFIAKHCLMQWGCWFVMMVRYYCWVRRGGVIAITMQWTLEQNAILDPQASLRDSDENLQKCGITADFTKQYCKQFGFESYQLAEAALIPLNLHI